MLKSRRWLLLVGILLAGCGDDPTKIIVNRTSAKAIVTSLNTGEPVAGIKILAMDQLSNTPVAGPFITDAAGEIDFGVGPELISGYLVFGGLDWQLHSQQPGDWKSFTENKTPPESNPLTHFIVRRTTQPGDGLPRIAGTVVDATTGAPLNQVIISTLPNLGAYNSDADPGVDVTGTDGAFVLQEILFAIHPITENLIQVERLYISRQGYRPLTYLHTLANGDNNLDITGVEIALTPMSESDTGILTGRILRDGIPQHSVRVGLGGFSADKNGAGVIGQTALTDADGIYRFTGLATGTYLVDPGYLLYDNYLFAYQARPPIYDVASGQATTAIDLQVFWEISPLPGDTQTISIGRGHTVMSWSPVDDATAYVLQFDGFETVRTPINQFLLMIPAETPPGWYRWLVTAEFEDGNPLGAMQKVAWVHFVE